MTKKKHTHTTQHEIIRIINLNNKFKEKKWCRDDEVVEEGEEVKKKQILYYILNVMYC